VDQYLFVGREEGGGREEGRGEEGRGGRSDVVTTISTTPTTHTL